MKQTCGRYRWYGAVLVRRVADVGENPDAVGPGALYERPPPGGRIARPLLPRHAVMPWMPARGRIPGANQPLVLLRRRSTAVQAIRSIHAPRAAANHSLEGSVRGRRSLEVRSPGSQYDGTMYRG